MFVYRRAGLITCFGMAIALQSCHQPYVPDLDGTYVPHSATVQTDKKTQADILESFKQAEDAVKRKDTDALMEFYANNYKHRGFTKDSLRSEWKQLFQEYRDFSATHVLTHIVVDADRVPLTARSLAQEVFGRFPMTQISESTLTVGTMKFTILPT